jgi:hypothetical protein
VATGDLDQFRPPMTGTERRIHPFHQKTTRAIRDRCGAFAHVFNALGQIYDQFLRTFTRIARVRDAPNIAENIGQTCRLEVHYPRRTRQSLRKLRYSSVADSAYVAQFLGQNYVRQQFSQKRFVDRVNGAVVLQGTAHPLVHFAARHIRIVNGTVGDARPFVSLFRKIALMRNANDPIHQPKGSHDFGRSRQERNDARHSQPYTLLSSQ